MARSTAIRIAALAGFLAVLLGAFGAHGLESILERNNRVETWHTAALYHIVHAAVLLGLAYRAPLRIGPFIAFLCGMVFFSGSLYIYAITNLRWLVAITPVGGVSLLAGWAWLIVLPESNENS